MESSEKLSLSPTDLAWLAGLLEGEGCFSYRAGCTPTISVGMADRDVMDRVAVLMGGHVLTAKKRQPHHKTLYIVNLNGTRAHRLMRTLQPFMGERRAAKIGEILAADGIRVENCERCGAPVVGQTKKQRFCTYTCQVAAWKERAKEKTRGNQGSV